jgi:hypothetical protein
MVQDTVIEFISLIIKCTVNGPVLLTDVLNAFLETLLTIMFLFRCEQILSRALQNCGSVCVSFLYSQEAIMYDKEVLKSNATKMPRIILQRAEEVFPVLKESLVSVFYRKLIYQLVL